MTAKPNYETRLRVHEDVQRTARWGHARGANPYGYAK